MMQIAMLAPLCYHTFFVTGNMCQKASFVTIIHIRVNFMKGKYYDSDPPPLEASIGRKWTRIDANGTSQFPSQCGKLLYLIAIYFRQLNKRSSEKSGVWSGGMSTPFGIACFMQ